jgi:hypothetical protein
MIDLQPDGNNILLHRLLSDAKLEIIQLGGQGHPHVQYVA